MNYTLVGDGGSDRILMPMLTWSLSKQGIVEIFPQWADPYRMPRFIDLGERLRAAIDLYPCDVLFVHRDAERETPVSRRKEIADAASTLRQPHIPVIPVRMTEAWLLFDENGIRNAAGNPNGTSALHLPAINRCEAVPDPKQVLHTALSLATGLNARRRSRITVQERVHHLANYIDDFSPLLSLPSFQSLQEDVGRFVAIR